MLRSVLSGIVFAGLLSFVTGAGAADDGVWKGLYDAGTAAYNRGDRNEAAREFELALKEAQTFGELDPRLATTLAWVAELYRSQRRFTEAEPLVKRAIEIDEKTHGPDHPNVAMSLNSLALLYHNQGRQGEIEPVLKRALAIFEKSSGPEHPFVATNLNNLGMLYRNQGRLAEAEPLLKRALAIREKVLGASHPETVMSRNNLALIQNEQVAAPAPHKPPLVAAVPRPAAPAPAPAPAPVPKSPAAVAPPPVAAQARAVAPSPKPPAVSAPPAVAPSPRPPSGTAPPTVATAPRASSPAPKPAPPGAVQTRPGALASKPSIAAIKPQPVVPFPPKVVVKLPEFRAHRSTLAWQVSNLSAAAARSPAETSVFAQRAYEAMQQARIRSATSADALMAERFSRVDEELARLVKARQGLLERWYALDKSHIDELSKAGPQRSAGPDQRLPDELAALDQRLREQDVLIGQRYPQYRELLSPGSLPLEEARALLGPDEALLSYLIDERASYLIAVNRSRIDFLRLEIGRDELRLIVKNLREHLDSSGDRAERNLRRAYPVTESYQLYRRIVAPAEAVLRGVSRVMVVPDDALQSLPFGALVAETSSTPARDTASLAQVAWLARRYAFTVMPSDASLRTIRRYARPPVGSEPFAGFGDPLLRGDERQTRHANLSQFFPRGPVADVNEVRRLAPLPDSRDGLYAVADLLQAERTEVHVQADATETNVKQMNLSGYAIVAFSTYGFLGGESKAVAEPALVLTPPERGTELDDGLLTASEVAQLKLNTDWVLLSACTTAAGDGTPGAEGLPSLSRAFFHAGSRALLLSHWTAPSDVVLKLTTRTLRESARGAGRAEALQRSMFALMNGEDRIEYVHPMFWAAFTLVGEGRAAAVMAAPSTAGPAREEKPSYGSSGASAGATDTPRASPAPDPPSGGAFDGARRLLQGIFGGGKD
ncbi:MAG: CHAT domain-containing protein [Betaproteobacteria bacterium]|nr:CHAT domain-containing protein [Betaproteobacteria bacterium]